MADHARNLKHLRTIAGKQKRPITIMGDLPGPKLRIGQFDEEPVELKQGASFLLAAGNIAGDRHHAATNFPQLPRVVKEGDHIYLNDGIIRLEVTGIEEDNVLCTVLSGGLLWSRKGINLPGIDLGIGAFTDADKAHLEFAAQHGVDAISQSFVENETDVAAVRHAAEEMGYHPFIIAKIERARALDHIEGILHEADGIMVARGDLGVEIPIERIAVVQKQLVTQANARGKPVIIATQMLESMTDSLQPTRAEVTDVSNAILDGTDCMMLSGESAMGKYPAESTRMLARIAAAVEPERSDSCMREALEAFGESKEKSRADLIALSVERILEHASPAAVFVPTKSGYTARNIARFRLPVWIVAVSTTEKTCRDLQLSYGIYPLHVRDFPDDWKEFARVWLAEHNIGGDFVVLTQGPSPKNPDANDRMELIDLS